MKRYYNEDEFNFEESETTATTELNEEEEFGCKFCYDRRKKKDKELFFLDHANNMRVCLFCPYCGREY